MVIHPSRDVSALAVAAAGREGVPVAFVAATSTKRIEAVIQSHPPCPPGYGRPGYGRPRRGCARRRYGPCRCRRRCRCGGCGSVSRLSLLVPRALPLSVLLVLRVRSRRSSAPSALVRRAWPFPLLPAAPRRSSALPLSPVWSGRFRARHGSAWTEPLAQGNRSGEPRPAARIGAAFAGHLLPGCAILMSWGCCRP